MFKPCDVEHFLLRSSWWAMTHSSDTNSKRNEDSFRRPSLDSFLRSPLNAEDTYATLTPNHKFTLLSMIKFAYGIHPRRETLPLPRCHLSSLSLKRLCHFMLEAFDSRVRVQDCGADPDVRFFLGIDPSDGYAASILCCAARLSTDSTAYATHVLVELLCTHRYARTRELLHRGADAWKRNAVEAVCREGRVTEKKRKLQTRTLECILTPVETQERWVFVAFAAIVLHQCAAVAAGGAQMENDFMEILERSNIRVDLNQYRLAAREKEMKSTRSCANRDKRRINLSKVNKCCLSSVHPGILSSLRVQKETLTSSELLTSALSVETRKRKQSQGPWFQFCKEGDEVEEEEGEIMMEAIRDWLLEAESKALKNDLAMPLPLENIPAGVLEGGGSQFKNSSIQENVTQMEEEEKDDLFIYEDCEGSETESP